MKYPVYNQQGEQIKEIQLSKRIFGATPKAEVIHQVVVAQQANAREAIAHTKTKGEVRGGGKKPWKQKGTGRARHGSSRSPIWVGGGVTFGPRNNRNFTLKVNKKQKQAALAMCLSQAISNKTLVIFDKLATEAGKTKELIAWTKSCKANLVDIKDSKKLLLVMDAKDDKLTRSAKNLKNIETISFASLNCVDILHSDAILVSEKAIEAIEKHFKKVNEKKETKE